MNQEAHGAASSLSPDLIPTQPDLPYDATDVDDGAMTTTGHQGLGCSLSDEKDTLVGGKRE